MGDNRSRERTIRGLKDETESLRARLEDIDAEINDYEDSIQELLILLGPQPTTIGGTALCSLYPKDQEVAPFDKRHFEPRARTRRSTSSSSEVRVTWSGLLADDRVTLLLVGSNDDDSVEDLVVSCPALVYQETVSRPMSTRVADKVLVHRQGNQLKRIAIQVMLEFVAEAISVRVRFASGETFTLNHVVDLTQIMKEVICSDILEVIGNRMEFEYPPDPDLVAALSVDPFKSLYPFVDVSLNDTDHKLIVTYTKQRYLLLFFNWIKSVKSDVHLVRLQDDHWSEGAKESLRKELDFIAREMHSNCDYKRTRRLLFEIEMQTDLYVGKAFLG